MIQVIKRGTAEILEENEQGIFLRDMRSNTFMLTTDNPETGKEWLKKYEHRNYSLMNLFQKEIAKFASERYGLLPELECYQAVYMGTNPISSNKRLQIRVASLEDYEVIAEFYKVLSEVELKHIIRRGELFIGYYQEQMVGFVGQHLEGSMGLLEILPQYRRNGFGQELEETMINYMLEQGLIPFCQVEVMNESSLKLQEKLGLSISRERMYWLF